MSEDATVLSSLKTTLSFPRAITVLPEEDKTAVILDFAKEKSSVFREEKDMSFAALSIPRQMR